MGRAGGRLDLSADAPAGSGGEGSGYVAGQVTSSSRGVHIALATAPSSFTVHFPARFRGFGISINRGRSCRGSAPTRGLRPTSERRSDVSVRGVTAEDNSVEQGVGEPWSRPGSLPASQRDRANARPGVAWSYQGDPAAIHRWLQGARASTRRRGTRLRPAAHQPLRMCTAVPRPYQGFQHPRIKSRGRKTTSLMRTFEVLKGGPLGTVLLASCVYLRCRSSASSRGS